MQKIAKKAIDAALRSDWQKAIELNLLILEQSPKNIDAKNRLAKAYIQTDQIPKAKKVLKEVLDTDPINPVAKKNLKILKGNAKGETPKDLDPAALVKEPGTTLETNLSLVAKSLSPEDFTPGEKLNLSKKQSAIDVTRTDSKKVIARIDQKEIINRLARATKEKADITIRYVKGEDRTITVIIKSSIPVFKSQKQDIRPYVKKGTLAEPKMELLAEESETENS